MPGLDPGIHMALEMDKNTLGCGVKPGVDEQRSCIGHYYTGR